MRRIAACAAIAVAFAGAPASSGSKDPYIFRQWGLTKVRAAEAWKISRGRGVVVAIVDSGIDLHHPDLYSKLVPGKNFVRPGTPPHDDFGHGTHVAGIVAAATSNGIGIAGVAPDAKLMPVKVLDANNTGTIENIVAGIRFATARGAKVINLSLSENAVIGRAGTATGENADLHAALNEAWSRGVVVIAAAGNATVPWCSEPAAAAKVVCVGALGPDDRLAWYSESDAAMTQWYLCAPGGSGVATELGGFGVGSVDSEKENVLSTVGRGTNLDQRKSGYVAMSGTSMAAPHVSGVAALLVARRLSNQQVVDRLLTRSADLGAPGRDPVFGAGRLDAAAALR